MFKKLKEHFKFWWNVKKAKLYVELVSELRTFTNENADNDSLDKRLWSLYYFLGQHKDYDALIVTLNRFLKAQDSYTKSEVMVIKLLLFRLEAPLFWLNRIIYPVQTD